MDVVMLTITQAGEDYTALGGGVALYLGGGPRLRRTAALATCSYLGATTMLLGIRAIVNRPRPEDPDPGWFGSSFPSGHATSYFATATVYAHEFPELVPYLGAGGGAGSAIQGLSWTALAVRRAGGRPARHLRWVSRGQAREAACPIPASRIAMYRTAPTVKCGCRSRCRHFSVLADADLTAPLFLPTIHRWTSD